MNYLLKKMKRKESTFTILKNDKVENRFDYLLQFDGLATPNPGEATSGAVVFQKNDKERSILFEQGEYYGYATNNQAEYMGLIIGLETCINFKIKNLYIEGDSMLIINQITNKWKVKNEDLKVLHGKVMQLFKKFNFIAVRHIYRDKNTHADALTNETFEFKEAFIRF